MQHVLSVGGRKSQKGSNDVPGSIGRLAIAVALYIAGIPAIASELSGRVTAVSEYIYRGQAVSDGNPALQLGLDYEHDSGLFGGLWASTIDVENAFSQRDKELDAYAGYHFSATRRLALAGTLIRYTYPGQRGVDYNYTEALLTATLDGLHSVEFGFTSDLYGLGGTGRHWELRTERPLASAWVLSAGVGYNDLTDYGGERYLHWDAGASARIYRLTIDLRWFDNESTGVAIGGESAGSQIVVSLSAVF